MVKLESGRKKPTYTDHVCYKCEKPLSTATTLIKHIQTAHNIQLPSRIPGIRRKVSHKYEFINSRSKPHEVVPLGCPFCWFHCSSHRKRGGLAVMTRHIEQYHLGPMSEGYESPLDDTDESDDDVEMADA